MSVPRIHQNTYFNANCTILGPPEVVGVAFAAEQPVVLALAAQTHQLSANGQPSPVGDSYIAQGDQKRSQIDLMILRSTAS